MVQIGARPVWIDYDVAAKKILSPAGLAKLRGHLSELRQAAVTELKSPEESGARSIRL